MPKKLCWTSICCYKSIGIQYYKMEQRIWFKDSHGNKLCGILASSAKDMKQPIFILCNGFAASKNNTKYSELIEILNKNNISTFRFDFYGHGESQGNFDNITISKSVDGILQAIKNLKTLGYKKIGLIGSSFGGMASIIAASKSKDLFLLALISPVSDYKELTSKKLTKTEIDEWKTNGYRIYTNIQGKRLRLNYTFFEDFKNNDGYKAAKKIKIPTLIVHGEEDNSVPPGQSRKISKLIKKCELILIKESDHRYTNREHFNEMIKIISSFIIEKCKKFKK